VGRKKHHIRRDCKSDGLPMGSVRIVMASDCHPCLCCGEPYCVRHRKHYSDCSCVGPHNADEFGYDVVEIGGVMWGILKPF
jgi:hypothetical protein